MRCPYCKEINQDKVIDSRISEGGDVIRRRRLCMACNKRYTTKERAETDTRITVVKRDGTKVPYDRNKVIGGLRRACYKRPIDDGVIDALADRVEDVIYHQNEREVSSQGIGLIISSYLQEVDPIAYLRFASVYRRFQDLGEFINEAQEVMARHANTTPGQQSLFE